MAEMSKTRTILNPDMTGRIVVTQFSDAPRERVFQMMTDRRRIPDWWGPRGLTTTVDKMSVRPGGAWRFIQHDSAGNVFAFNGLYHVVVPPERLVYTFEWEGMPGHVLLETVTLEEMPGGGTQVTDSSVFQTVEDRDGMVQTGMEEGASESTERLAEILRAG